MLSVGGSRIFVVGLYQLPRGSSDWKEVQAAGFNLVHVNAGQLHLAATHGVYGWIGVGSIARENRAAGEERIRKIVAAARDNPALLFWETEDEPTFVWKKPEEIRIPPERIIETYRLLKSLDPARPLYLNHSPTHLEATLRAYNPGADLIATDIYPVVPRGIRELYALWPDGQQGDLLNQSISQVGQYADKMRRVAGPSRAVFMVLQAFAWETLRKEGQDPAMVLYPTREETRFMAYQSVVHGVNGVIYWGLSYTPREAPLWADLKAVAGELHALKEELAARRLAVDIELGYADTGHSLDRGVEWIVKPGARGDVLIAVNADRNPVRVTFRGLNVYRSCRVLFESRPADFASGTLRDRFAPFDVRVYRLVKSR